MSKYLFFFRDVWSVEKLILSDGYGNARSWCKEHGELLPKNSPVNVPLSFGECSTGSPTIVDKGTTLPSQGLLAPAPPLPVKPGTVRPPLVNNDISKHGDILENNGPSADSNAQISEPTSQFNLNTIPRPVLVPVKPQLTVLPVKTQPPPLVKHEQQYHWNNKPTFNHRPPIQPYHLQGPPGAWNIVTSKPGSLPPPIHVYQSKLPLQNSEGVEIQLGPRLPLPPLHKSPFPPRRRPSTPVVNLPVIDMTTSDSETSILFSSSTEKHLLATERVDQIPEADVIVIESNQLKNNFTHGIENKTLNDTQDIIKNDILADDKLTIFKVGPDNDIVRVSNDTAENDTDTKSRSDYKFVILHKLPNGNAVNLENLKTYNYEDLMKGHSSVIEDADHDKIFDRENLEFFDVPRRVSNDRPDPYIIYQLPDKHTDGHLTAPYVSKEVYRPNVQPVYKPTPTLQTVQNHEHANNLTMTTPTTSNNPDTYITNSSRTTIHDEWIPRNKSEKDALTLNALSELSQLAQISITDKGPLKVKKVGPQKLNVQLLPPRLSAVLSHLDTTYKERDRNLNLERDKDRSGNSRAVSSNHRQNKISPVFQHAIKSRDRLYARRIHNSDYVVTQPYQSQVIPNIKHRYIPLLQHPNLPLWWHPQKKEYQIPPMRPHQLLQTSSSFSKISKPIADSKSQEYSFGNLTNEDRFKTNVANLSNADNAINSKKPIYIISKPVTEVTKQGMKISYEKNTTEESNNKTVQKDFDSEGNMPIKPIYIISMNETSIIESTTTNYNQFMNGDNTTSNATVVDDISPLHNFTLSTEHLSSVVPSDIYQEKQSQVFLGQTKSAENQKIAEEASLRSEQSHHQLLDVNSNDNIKEFQELSENNEYAIHPASGN